MATPYMYIHMLRDPPNICTSTTATKKTIDHKAKEIVAGQALVMHPSKLCFLTLCAFLIVHQAVLAHDVPEDLSSDDKLDALFKSWMSTHHKVYNGVEEKTKRFKAFKDNLNYINERNKEITGYWLSLNEFADLTHEEFNVRYLGGLKGASPKRSFSREFRYGNVSNLPESVDWRARGAVTPAKSQGNCGCCRAFSAVAAVEGINQIVTGKLLNLSEQELVDCDKDYNNGCKGGLMDPAFKFITASGGLHREDDYPYLARDGPCQKKEGVFDGACGTQLNHGVTAVGYGSAEGKDYIIVKNSWGPTWGEEGFIRIKRNDGSPMGLCGIY